VRLLPRSRGNPGQGSPDGWPTWRRARGSERHRRLVSCSHGSRGSSPGGSEN
jgi:hypothetical protein